MNAIAPTTPLESLAADLLTTAVEGGSGYWSCVSDIERAEDLTVLSVRVHPEDDDGELEGFQQFGIFGSLPSGTYDAAGKVINYSQMVAAMIRVAHDDIKYVSQRTRDEFGALLANPTPEAVEVFDYDADDADVVLQVAVLGEVVYG